MSKRKQTQRGPKPEITPPTRGTNIGTGRRTLTSVVEERVTGSNPNYIYHPEVTTELRYRNEYDNRITRIKLQTTPELTAKMGKRVTVDFEQAELIEWHHHDGFLGSWLTKHINTLGTDVRLVTRKKAA